jgi:hypothetical protein
MVFPFFHGMSRYFFTTYLTRPDARLAPVAGHIMFDGMMFLGLAAIFFVMSRSLSPSHWMRFYVSLIALLAVDTAWIVVSVMKYGAPLLPWLWLNIALGVILLGVLAKWHPTNTYDDKNPAPIAPSWMAAGATLITSTLDYVLMSDFYFP